jgi:glycosyltransferase 2 family protein
MAVKGRDNLFFLLRIVISLGLVVLLFHKVDLDQFLTSILSAKKEFLSLGYVLGICNVMVCTLRWRILLWDRDINVSFNKLMKIYFIGMFFNIFFPTGYGGDAVRGYKLYKVTSAMSESVSSVVMDRLVGFSALLSISIISLGLSFDFINAKICFSVFGIALLFFAGVWFFFSAYIVRCVGFILRIFKLERYMNGISRFHETILSYKDSKMVLLGIFGISIFAHSIMILSVYLFSLSIGVQIPVLYFFLFVPVINIVTLAPVSVSGIGIREAGFMYFFSMVLVSASDSFLMSALFFSQLVFVGLIGCLFYLFGSD